MNLKNKLRPYVQSRIFKRSLKVLGFIFIVLAFFITINPDPFLKLGLFGVFAYNTINSGLLLIPVLEKEFNLLALVLVSSLGNIINTTIYYLIGYTSKTMFSGVTIVTKLKSLIRRFGLIVVFVLALLPLPIDIAGLLSGYIGIPYKKFIIVVFSGRSIAFLLEGLGLIYLSKIFF